MRKILYDTSTTFLQDILSKLETANKLDIVLFAFFETDKIIASLDSLGEEELAALHEGRVAMSKWTKGDIKMPQAKPWILKIHVLAKTKDKGTETVLHAIAQAWSSIHAKRHILSFLFYYLTSLHLEGIEEPYSHILDQLQSDLTDIQNTAKTRSEYAEFLRK